MLLQIQLYERADRHDFQLIEMSVVERSASQLAAHTSFSHEFGDLSMDQSHDFARTPVLQEGSSFLQRDLKLAFGLIVLNGITAHAFLPCPSPCLNGFYANATRRQGIIAPEAILLLSIISEWIPTAVQLLTLAIDPVASAGPDSFTGHELARHASR
jgi:hypothetical protein